MNSRSTFITYNTKTYFIVDKDRINVLFHPVLVASSLGLLPCRRGTSRRLFSCCCGLDTVVIVLLNFINICLVFLRVTSRCDDIFGGLATAYQRNNEKSANPSVDTTNMIYLTHFHDACWSHPPVGRVLRRHRLWRNSRPRGCGGCSLRPGMHPGRRAPRRGGSGSGSTLGNPWRRAASRTSPERFLRRQRGR